MQSVKLLQLKKSTIEDIDIIYDICWTLTPAQIQKLINAYLVADYEQPISPEILTAVAARVKNDDKDNTLLLESIPIDDSGPFEIMEPRTLKRIESYIPGFLQVPNLRRLAELTAKANQSAAANGGPEAFDSNGRLEATAEHRDGDQVNGSGVVDGLQSNDFASDGPAPPPPAAIVH
jgi:myosin-5